MNIRLPSVSDPVFSFWTQGCRHGVGWPQHQANSLVAKSY